MLIPMTSNELSPLGQYIKHHLDTKYDDEGRPWSQNKLARLAGLSSGGLSMIMRGTVAPEGSTLKQIADALGIDARPLLEIAGILDPEQSTIDPKAAYIAQRLSKLPPELREKAIDAVSGVVDSFTEVADQRPLAESQRVKDAKRGSDGVAERYGLDDPANHGIEQNNFR